MCNPNSRLDIGRERSAAEVVTVTFDRKPDDLAVVDVEHSLVDQEAIDDRIEVAVVLNVIDMAINIIVHPARRDGQKMAIVATLSGLLFFHVNFLQG
jgi:hypothetical protein